MKRVLIGAVALILAISATACSGGDSTHEGEVQMIASSSDYVGEHFEVAVEELKDAGFTNVRTKPLGDLVTGWLKSDGELEKIRLAGSNSFSSGEWFPANAKIVITYHSFPEKEKAAPVEKTTPAPQADSAPEPKQAESPDAERSVALEYRLKEIFGGVGSMSELLLEMPTDWPGYVVGVRVEGDLAYFTLQVDRNTPDGKRLGEDAARALSTLLGKEDVKDINWLIVEDGTGVVIDQKQPNPNY